MKTNRKAAQAKRPPRGEAQAPAAGQDARQGTKAPQTREELRARVLDRCERELRDLASGPRGNPDAFIRGLRSVAVDIEMSYPELRTVQKGYQLLTQIRDARDEAQKLLTSQQDSPLAKQAPLNALANIVELLRSVPGARAQGRTEFFFHYPEETKHVTRREQVLRQFDNRNFVGQHRHATLRELALLSLFMDPDHGIEGRVGRSLGTVWSIFRREENAIRLARERLRKADPVYRRDSTE
jgi:hypothetical protein